MGSAVGRGSEGYFAGVRAGVPFALVVGVVAFSFGVLARSLGWGVIAPIVFSVATFSVTAQFAVAMVLGAGGGGIDGDRRRSAAERPLLAHRRVRGPVP
jgi:predicted branched-subunit amino acid permease